MNTIREKTQELKTSILRFAASARAVVREVCTFEFLGLATMLLPALMASVGFFFGKTVSPIYFYAAVAILTSAAFLVGWRRGLAYLALLAVCTVLTMYTFSYVGTDAQSYHFPMQYLLHHGWNPIFDSTVEKFKVLTDETQLWHYHALFLPKFSALCGAIVAAAFHLFEGDAFLGYILAVSLLVVSAKFARRYWSCSALWCVLFAGVMTFSNSIVCLILGLVDYSSYSSFCISMLSLVLYVRDRRVSDLATFAVAACICMTLKTTGIVNCGLLVLMTLPLLFKRTAYWRALLWIGIVVAIVGASPLLTNWIQYGSPFYPSMTFSSNVDAIDLTSDFIANGDAQNMGYLSRICYAWISPDLAIAATRLLSGNSDFSPVFKGSGALVSGNGPMFNALLLISVCLLIVARKNVITWLCVVVFVSSNFAPVKYIGYSRYFPQIWAIFPLAVMNFAFTTKDASIRRGTKSIRMIVCVLLFAALAGTFASTLFESLQEWRRMLVQERMRQDLIDECAKNEPIVAEVPFFLFTTVQRFKQAGVTMIKAQGVGNDPVLTKVAVGDDDLPCYGWRPRGLLRSFRTRDHIEKTVARCKWRAIFELMPHVLWDNQNQ